MQDCYVGDVGDYGKFALLRAVTEAGLSLAVNWYHVKGIDAHGTQEGGNYTDYLNREEEYCTREQEELFKKLKEIVDRKQRKISRIEDSHLLDAAFFTDPIPSTGRDRDVWHARALARTAGADVVFLDPDNGLEPEKSGYNEKHVRVKELKDYYSRRQGGQTVILYQHRPQMTAKAACVARVVGVDRDELHADHLFALEFPRFTNRFYFIFAHEKHAAVLDELCTRLPERLPKGFCRRVDELR